MRWNRIITLALLAMALVSFLSCGGKNTNSNPGSLKKGSPEFFVNEGLAYLNMGDLEKAEKRFQQALAKSPEMPPALNGIGIVCLQKRDFDKASQYFRRVLQINPKFFEAYNFLGVINSELGNYDLARENFLVAANAEKYPTPENPYTNLALLEIKNNKPESAMRYIEKGLEFNKNFPALHNVKGIVHEHVKEYGEAVKAYEKALSLLTHEDANILVNLGRAFSLNGEKNRALDTLEKAISITVDVSLRGQIRTMIEDIEGKK